MLPADDGDAAFGGDEILCMKIPTSRAQNAREMGHPESQNHHKSRDKGWRPIGGADVCHTFTK
jgi:hypothetical protein